MVTDCAASIEGRSFIAGRPVPALLGGRMLRAVALAVAALVALPALVTGCGSGDGGSEMVTASVELPGGLSVSDASVGEGDRIAAGYMIIAASGSGDRLLAASSPAATRISLHSTTAEGSMKAIDGLELPAGEPVALVPGGSHLMLEGLVAPLTPGESVALDLTFEIAGEVELLVPVVALVDVLDVYSGGW